jgi:hypothetical protein
MAAIALRHQAEYGNAQFVCTLCYEALRGLSLFRTLNDGGAVPAIPEPDNDERCGSSPESSSQCMTPTG